MFKNKLEPKCQKVVTWSWEEECGEKYSVLCFWFGEQRDWILDFQQSLNVRMCLNIQNKPLIHTHGHTYINSRGGKCGKRENVVNTINIRPWDKEKEKKKPKEKRYSPIDIIQAPKLSLGRSQTHSGLIYRRQEIILWAKVRFDGFLPHVSNSAFIFITYIFTILLFVFMLN